MVYSFIMIAKYYAINFIFYDTKIFIQAFGLGGVHEDHDNYFLYCKNAHGYNYALKVKQRSMWDPCTIAAGPMECYMKLLPGFA